MPRAVPRQVMRIPPGTAPERRSRASARASIGSMCPPVPPPASTTCTGRGCTSVEDRGEDRGDDWGGDWDEDAAAGSAAPAGPGAGWGWVTAGVLAVPFSMGVTAV